MSLEDLNYNAVITKRTDLADGLAVFRVEPDDESFASFVPGQYAILGLNHTDKGRVQRAYSIASPPQDLPQSMDFYVRYVKDPASDNPLTHLLFNCHEGDRIYVGPKLLGKFTLQHELPEGDNRWRVCVGAGTGLAPFTSMVFDEIKRTGKADRFIVLHGVSYAHDLGYRDELTKCLNEDMTPNRYFPTISRPGQKGEVWPDENFTGRAEGMFEPDKLIQWELQSPLGEGGLRPDNAVIFICGLTGTISNTLVRALERGFIPAEKRTRRILRIPKSVPSSLFFEKYDSEPTIDEHDAKLIGNCWKVLERIGIQLDPIPDLESPKK